MRLAAVLLVLALSGCLSAGPGPELVPVRERADQGYVVQAEWSSTLVAGPYDILEPQSHYVDVDLPVDELGGAADPLDPPRIHLGLFLPDVPPGTRVPVVADVGPYYEDGDVAADARGSGRLGEFLIENLVPHGFAVAQVSVFGSGKSNHCMDLMGRSEQIGIDAAVTWLGQQDWSNGNVGLIGRSYDGSTPWEAATFGNPHLKTIVPISGLTGVHELMWKNGSAESRGPRMHGQVYGLFGVDSGAQGIDAEDRQTLCRDYAAAFPQGYAAYLTGDHVAPEVNEYWQERAFLDRALANYKGSVYLIHGLQDWNVDPHMAFPTHQRLLDAGIEVRGLYGQWGHMYPDRLAEHQRLEPGFGGEAVPASVRMDWAQDLLEWFDHYLRDGPRPELHAEVQDQRGAWRIEETYPPQAQWQTLRLSEANVLADQTLIGSPVVAGRAPADQQVTYTFTTPKMRLAGLTQLHVDVTPTGPGGQLYAELSADGMRLGHAVMDLRYHAGGTERQEVVPGQTVTARMEFFAMDVVLPEGDLTLRLAPTGRDYLPSAVSDPVLIHDGQLRLPVIERGPEAFFTPPGPK